MNYQKIYNQLIEKRKQYTLNKKECYCEKHHIIPKSLGGNNNADNLVNLLAREHYIAHLLLVKITEYKFGKDSIEHEKMVCALWRFIYDNETNTIINSHKYEKIKKIFSQTQSKRVSGNKNGMYGRIGKLNPMYGHSCFEFMTEEQILNWKHKQSLSHKGKRAWNKGKTNVYSKETLKKISETRIKNKCAKGKNNPMYGVSLITLLSADEIKQWKNKLSEKSKGRKHMYHPETLKNINPKIEDIQKYLELGYVLGQYNKNKKNKQK